MNDDQHWQRINYWKDRALRAEHDLNQLTGPLAVDAAKALREDPDALLERDRADALEEKLRAAEAERDAWATRWQTAARRADTAQARAASWWEAAKHLSRRRHDAIAVALACSDRSSDAGKRAASWWEAAKTLCRERDRYRRHWAKHMQLSERDARHAQCELNAISDSWDELWAQLDVAQQRVSELEEDLAHALDQQREDAEDYWSLASFADHWQDEAAHWRQRAEDVAWAWAPNLNTYNELLAEWGADDTRPLGNKTDHGENE